MKIDKLYLMSGHTSTNDLEQFDRRIVEELGKHNVLVLNLMYEKAERSCERRNFFEDYFYRVGARKVVFLDDKTNQSEVDFLFSNSDYVYLPGGHTEVLMNNIDRMGLVEKLRRFNGVLGGNSAGNYVQCPAYLKLREGSEPEIIPMMGLVDFWTKAHYEEKFDNDLFRLSEGRRIYGMENGSAIEVDDGKLNFLGNGKIFRFEEGKKERVW